MKDGITMKYNFPKIDLHLHLDGSIRTTTVWDIAQEKAIPMPVDTMDEYEKWMEKCSYSGSVNEFLKMFDVSTTVMQDKKSIARITKELVEDIAKQGVVYAEIRFAPQLHTDKGLSQAEAIEAVLEGAKQGMKENPSIKVGIICCMMCVGKETANWDANMETARLVSKYLDKGVVALDLAGAEGIVPLINFAPLFEEAHKLNTPCICHAGDSQDWTTVADALKMGAQRIGHGHHVYENPELCKYVAEHKIALEICPTSNVQCQTRESYKKHPARKLYDMGIPITINTDNMTMSRVTLDDEYDHCLNEMGFEYKDLIIMNINSAKYSFMKKEDKDRIIARLEECLNEIPQ